MSSSSQPNGAQGGARLVHQIAFQTGQGVQQRAAGQIFDRKIAHPFHMRVRHVPLRGKPAQGKLLAHRKRQRIVDIARRRRVGILAEGSGEAVQQRRLQRAGLQGDVSAVHELGINRVHVTGYYRVLGSGRAGDPHNAVFQLSTSPLAVGIDVGGSSIKCALIDLEYRRIRRRALQHADAGARLDRRPAQRTCLRGVKCAGRSCRGTGVSQRHTQRRRAHGRQSQQGLDRSIAGRTCGPSVCGVP